MLKYDCEIYEEMCNQNKPAHSLYEWNTVHKSGLLWYQHVFCSSGFVSDNHQEMPTKVITYV